MGRREVNGRIPQSYRELYFDWLYGKVMLSQQYRSLLRELHSYDYVYTLPMDGNCSANGIELRYYFANEENIDQRIIASEIDIRPCSMLEMMTALAMRVSDGVLDDGSINGTNVIFMVMLTSLGLDIYTEHNFSIDGVEDSVKAFNNGELYLFPTFGEDTYGQDLWYQAHRFIRKGGV